MIYLNIGEPDFTAPPLVQAAAEARHPRRPKPVHPGHRPARAARGHQRLVRQPLRARHRSRPHRGHRRRLGRTAAGLPGADRGRRRSADARPQLPLQPPVRAGRRRHAGAHPVRAGRPLPAQRRARGCGLEARHARRAAGLAVQPHRHLDRPRRAGAHRPLRARRAASRWSTRSTSACRTTRPTATARWGCPTAWATRSSASTASASTST